MSSKKAKLTAETASHLKLTLSTAFNLGANTASNINTK